LQPKNMVQALEKTRLSFWGRIKSTVTGQVISDQDVEALEEILYTSDLGPRTVEHLMKSISQKISVDQNTLADLRRLIKEEMYNLLIGAQSEAAEGSECELNLKFNLQAPTVWLFVGVNGSGKTTTIGKLANKLALAGKKVLVVAGDTFRAAAGEQLKIWADRADVEIFWPDTVKDPSAVAFDACQKALARKFDVVLIDTAGRLHTQKNLMEEIKKMKRVVQKAIPSAPDEVILILDANAGQNGLVQARQFGEALDLSGVILTKLDGTAKGGVVVGVAAELKLPIKFIGVGEKINDLRIFSAQEFVDSIVE
jgi:fused signal recognition particle receptor